MMGLRVSVAVAVMLALAACGESALNRTPSPNATLLPSSTPTSLPTESPTATPIPPTLTVSPTPTSSGAPLDGESALPVRFPRDEALHDVPLEWWYFNGHLSDVDGRAYSFHFVGIQGRMSGGIEARAMHWSLGVPGEDVVIKAEKWAPGKTRSPESGFAVALDGWSIRGSEGAYALEAETGGRGFSLRLEETKAPALHGEDGIIDMGPAGDSYYYSRTRLRASGTLALDGVSLEVSGDAWMDHQWGDFGQERIRWNWFSLQLDDGSELMAVFFWDLASREPFPGYATFVDLGGMVRYLQPEDVRVKALGSWTSPRTGASYPTGWLLEVPALDMSLTIDPVHRDAEFDVSVLTSRAYWEGAAVFSGKSRGTTVAGRGYVEMGGYDLVERPDEQPTER